MASNKQRFDELRDLERGWDSYDGLPPAEKAIMAAESIDSCLAYVPCGDGTIQMEFHAAGVDVELAISKAGKVTSIYMEEAQK